MRESRPVKVTANSQDCFGCKFYPNYRTGLEPRALFARLIEELWQLNKREKTSTECMVCILSTLFRREL